MTRAKTYSGLVLGLAAIMSTTAWPVAAETLNEALATAYTSNPVLDAQRASLRATDELHAHFQIARNKLGVKTLNLYGSVQECCSPIVGAYSNADWVSHNGYPFIHLIGMSCCKTGAAPG